jgi:arylsulfatase A-like enzyme
MNISKRIKFYWNQLRKGKKYFLISSILEDILRIPFYLLPHNGIKVMKENWDYLIILDACRFDTFKEVNDIPGKLEKKISSGSQTEQWLQKNFENYYDDVVYVSSNPLCSYVEKHGFRGTDHFFKVINVWDFGWDEELGTVLPEEVTKAAIKAKKRYPKKRMIIHYIQPHLPFIGETKIPLDQEKNVEMKTRNNKLYRKGYEDNLKLVLKEVKKLIKELDGGKIVITSDHGEFIGKNPLYEHPHHIYLKSLIEIPWLVVKKQTLR